MGKRNLDIALMILRNDRLSDYRSQLQFALSHGYRLGSLSDFLTFKSKEPYVILRHDVDVRDLGVKQMLDVEKKLGIASSWYFRWSTAKIDTIRDIKNAGGEVGLHYETLADVCLRYGIQNREQITPDLIEETRKELIEEIIQFRQKYQVSCRTIASHGHPINRKIRMANNEIIDQKLCESAGINLEAYDQALLKKIDRYISDTTPVLNFGWAYGMSLVEAINSGYQLIYFLSHPNHWFFRAREKALLMMKWIKRGVRIEDKKFRATFR
ncbi:MAG: hypothetical protein LWX01_01140 [Deltaproteobacteria bacterium]|nr:hypothetical protein [Deltaproteobacteria bacterium]